MGKIIICLDNQWYSILDRKMSKLQTNKRRAISELHLERKACQVERVRGNTSIINKHPGRKCRYSFLSQYGLVQVGNNRKLRKRQLEEKYFAIEVFVQVVFLLLAFIKCIKEVTNHASQQLSFMQAVKMGFSSSTDCMPTTISCS